jgi:hypothetical protein
MIKTLPLMTIITAWGKALGQNAEINAFCLSKYNKTPTIYVGINKKKPPTEDDCPYIVIRPGVKEEGELDVYSYVISVGWAIKNENETRIDEGNFEAAWDDASKQDGDFPVGLENDPLGRIYNSGAYAIDRLFGTQHEIHAFDALLQDGVYESDALGQKIYECLFDLSPYSPITLCHYELESVEFWPQFVGDMMLEIQITPTIGGQINY